MARVDPPVQSYMGRVLKRLGVPATPENLSFMVGWAGREGVPQSIDRYNYLGTTLPMDGSYGTNAPGVQSYPTEDAGVRAHASMLSQSNFAALRRMLASGNPYKLAGDPQVNAAMRLWSGGGYSWPLKGGSPDLGAALTNYPSSPPDSAPEALSAAPTASQGVPGGISPERLQLLSGRLARGGGFGSRYPELAAQLLQRRLGGAADVRVTPPQVEDAKAAPVASGATGGEVPTGPLPYTGAKPVRGALAEAFYDPLGQWDEGRFSSRGIGNHDDHVHLSVTRAQAMLAAIRKARQMGLDPRENLYSENVDPVHVPGSFHYQTFPGRYDGRQLSQGVDVSGDPAKMAAYFRWALENLR